MYHFVPGLNVGCFLRTSSTQRLFLAQSWCQWNSQSTSVFNRSYVYTRAIFAERTIILPLLENFFTRPTPQSTSLFSQDFVGTRVHCNNRHNQRRHNEVHAFLRVLVLEGKIHPCCNDNFFLFYLDTVFKWKTLSLFPSLYPSKMKTTRIELPPFWLVAVLSILSPSRAQRICAWHAHSLCRSVDGFLALGVKTYGWLVGAITPSVHRRSIGSARIESSAIKRRRNPARVKEDGGNFAVRFLFDL